MAGLGDWIVDRSGGHDERPQLNGSDSYILPADESTVDSDTWIAALHVSIEDIGWTQVDGAGELVFAPPDNIRTTITVAVAGTFVARLRVHYRMASGHEGDVIKIITVRRAAAG